MKTKVVHCKKEKYDVYIGRPGPWGNPFSIGKDGTREEVIEKFRDWIKDQDLLMQEIESLRGKTLGCWCCQTPSYYVEGMKMICHGEVLMEIINERKPK